MPRFQKLRKSATAGTLTMEATAENPVESIEQPEISENLVEPIEQPEISEDLLEPQDILAAVKARNTRALDELQKQMDDLSSDFADRAVAIVEAGFNNCFFKASQRIRDLQLTWTSDAGEVLDGTTVNTIALPSSTTDGDIE